MITVLWKVLITLRSIFLCIFIMSTSLFGDIHNVYADKNAKLIKTLTLANTRFKIVFEDNNYSAELSSEISEDLSLIYKQFDTHKILPEKVTASKKLKQFLVRGEEHPSRAVVHFPTTRYSFRPDRIKNELGKMIELDGSLYLIISERLIEEYNKALEFKRENSTAYHQLDDFIQYMDRLNVDALNENELEDFFYYVNYSKIALGMDVFYRNAKIYENYKIRKPSILDYFYVKHEGNIIPCYKTISTKKDHAFSEEIVLCYVNRKWHVTH